MDNIITTKEKAEIALRDKCYYLNFSQQKTELCVDYFINHLEHKEVIEKHNLVISVQSSCNKKLRLKQKLNI